jgi:hypothetical protein
MQAVAIVGLLGAGAVQTGCDRATDLSPTPSRLNLRAGLNYVSFLGLAVSNDPQFPPCTPIAVPRDGTSITTQVMLAQSGDEWTARSSSTAGTLEIHLRDTGRSSLQGSEVTGTVRGSAIDLGRGQLAPVDVRINVAGNGGSAALTGYVERTAFFATGRLSGSITFADSQNATASCTAIRWTMQPTTGVFAALSSSLVSQAW